MAHSVRIRGGAWQVRGVNGCRYRLAPIAAVLTIAFGLSGCIAAAVPLMGMVSIGAAAVSGFEMYKVVQLQGGGSIQIEFPGKGR